MFKLLRLPFVLLKWVLVLSLIAYVLLLFPKWGGELNVSQVVQVVQTGVAWMMEQIQKLP